MPTRLRRAFEILRGAPDAARHVELEEGGDPAPQVNAHYLTDAPSAQTQLDLFAGEWTSGVPVPGEPTTSGPRDDLFDDDRVRWAIETIGGVDGARVLELGPLEAGHTTMLEHAGAQVTAVEAHTRAFLRCLVVKNLLGLRARFELGDFVGYLRDTDQTWDLVLASGVLYHMTNPLELLALVADHTRRLALWTHYWDAAVLERRPDVAARFVGEVPVSHGGLTATGHQYEYREGPTQATFCGGSRPHAAWLSRDDLLGTLDALGFTEVAVQFDDPDYPHGPSISLVASRP